MIVSTQPKVLSVAKPNSGEIELRGKVVKVSDRDRYATVLVREKDVLSAAARVYVGRRNHKKGGGPMVDSPCEHCGRNMPSARHLAIHVRACPKNPANQMAGKANGEFELSTVDGTISDQKIVQTM